MSLPVLQISSEDSAETIYQKALPYRNNNQDDYKQFLDAMDYSVQKYHCPEALTELAWAFDNVMDSPKAAIDYYRQAANQGHHFAQFYLSDLILREIQMAGQQEVYQHNDLILDKQQPYITLSESFHLLEQCVSHHPEFQPARYALGLYYFHGYGCHPDLMTSYNLHHELAKEGYAEAAYRLGLHFLEGTLTGKADMGQALQWFLYATKLGHIVSMGYAGWIFYTNATGDVTDAEKKQGLHYLIESAQKGASISQGFLEQQNIQWRSI
jgi:TPR repeat protein